MCVSPRWPALSSLVLPTPVLSEIPSLAWPTIPFHRAPQGPQWWPAGCWIPWAQTNNGAVPQGPQGWLPGCLIPWADPLVTPRNASGAPVVAHCVQVPLSVDRRRRCAAGAPGLALWVPHPLHALTILHNSSGALLAHPDLPAEPPVGSIGLLDGQFSCCAKWQCIRLGGPWVGWGGPGRPWVGCWCWCPPPPPWGGEGAACAVDPLGHPGPHKRPCAGTDSREVSAPIMKLCSKRQAPAGCGVSGLHGGTDFALPRDSPSYAVTAMILLHLEKKLPNASENPFPQCHSAIHAAVNRPQLASPKRSTVGAWPAHHQWWDGNSRGKS